MSERLLRTGGRIRIEWLEHLLALLAIIICRHSSLYWSLQKGRPCRERTFALCLELHHWKIKISIGWGREELFFVHCRLGLISFELAAKDTSLPGLAGASIYLIDLENMNVGQITSSLYSIPLQNFQASSFCRLRWKLCVLQ